ncbi:MAG TPA: amylo-alpha-1,6-glucosidase [Candidatus Tectomicrobia bacterium]|nr:amylo-alpha-1,6-glucosidase [Candidatus Tectomicrobia bacterium]
MIEIAQDICTDLNTACQREWLETNGVGGFASSTIIGLNTRRYHGLLTAATKPPVGRLLLLSKLEETLILGGQRFELSANQYPGVIHPQGYRYLTGFRLDPFPIFTYKVDGLEIEKAVYMIQGENSTVIEYTVKGQPNETALLELRPLIAFRDYHSTTHENAALDAIPHMEPGDLAITPYQGLPTLHLVHDADSVAPEGHWYRSFEYAIERERGLDWVEDLFHPCTLQFDLSHRSQVAVIASTERRDIRRLAAYRQAEIDRRAALLTPAPSEPRLVRMLVAAADQFIVARGERRTVIAGYHWFSDWGRDTMIALPGLTLTTGRADVARSILLEFSRYVDRGMLPNRFPDAGEQPEYNTVDATLWFFEAVRAFLQHTGDEAFVLGTLYPVLDDIIAWHQRGTRYGIHVDVDGLLAAGKEGVQLTWMDARVGDRVITPRVGKPVEVQALWYNALCTMQALARACGDDARRKQYDEMAAQTQFSFNRLFWNDAAGCLYDVVDGDHRDGAVRPNQIFAVSLPYSMLPPERARGVVAVVARQLLTPYGLRSLASDDPHYCGRCEGDPGSRDAAYHQGTVWAWLMGPFITAYLNVNGRSSEARQQAATWLHAFDAHLHDAGLGQISEIFDGDAPHRPRGCMAQAWSVAELLRAIVEDVLGRQPTAAR